jgi:hypothetical protein
MTSKVRVHNRFWYSHKFKPGSIQFVPGFFITETDSILILSVDSLPFPVVIIANICYKMADFRLFSNRSRFQLGFS